MLFAQFALAEYLHKTIVEIQQMTVDEWNYWLAYFKIKGLLIDKKLSLELG